MKSIMYSLLLRVVAGLTSKDIVATLKDLVKVMMNVDIPGSEKRNRVLKLLSQRIDLSNTADYLINLALEAVVAWAKARA